MAHFARNNNVITRKHLIDIILQGEIDEFLIYASDYKEQIEWTKVTMDELILFFDVAGLAARGLRKLSRPEAAEVIKPFPKILWQIMFDNLEKTVSGKDFVASWDVHRWDRTIEAFLKYKEIFK
jgi:hypothetical protein